MRQPFLSALDHMASHDHDITSNDLFGPFDLKNGQYYNKQEYSDVAYQLKAKDGRLYVSANLRSND